MGAEMLNAAKRSSEEMPPPPPAQQPVFQAGLDSSVKQKLMGGAMPASQPVFSMPQRIAPTRRVDDRVIHPMPMPQQSLEAHNNVYVSGLPPGIDDSQFRQLFQKYGPIISTKIVPDKHYGFVKFATSKDATTAIESLHNFQFGGTKLTVRYAVRDGGVVASPAVAFDSSRFNVNAQVPSSN